MARHEIRRVTIAAEKRLPFGPLVPHVIDEVFPFPNLNKGGFHGTASVLVKCLQSQYEKGSPVSINIRAFHDTL